MGRATFIRNLALAGAIAMAATGVQALHAEEQEAKTTMLLKTGLAGVEGKEVQVKHLELPPGWVSSRHFHSGPVFVYVLEGSGVVDLEGKGPQTVGPGELFYEEPNQVMIGRNASATDWLKIILFQVQEEGAPLRVDVEE